ncbi:MAG TPA: hypothetical protein VFN26_06150 [Candidatus Acidoferrum sp.]|nr:hypothetical protein [Candidatus Acidoferrum sp.]
MGRNKASFVSWMLSSLISIGASSGCVRVPPQAVVLSRTVGQRLTDLQTSHEAFARAYFQVTRQRLEDFLVNQWTPTFLSNFVDKAELMNKLENVQPLTDQQKARLVASLQAASISTPDQSKVIQAVGNALGSTDRAKLVLQFSEAAMEQIQLKRKSLLNPIDDLERQTLTELGRAYAQIQEAQNTVTAHLSSISKVTEEQDKVLKQLGLLEKRDAIIDKAVNANQTIMEILNGGKDPEKTMLDLEDQLKNLTKPSN